MISLRTSFLPAAAFAFRDPLTHQCFVFAVVEGARVLGSVSRTYVVRGEERFDAYVSDSVSCPSLALVARGCD